MSAFVDVLVIGGGPAGATASVLLAEAGWSVVTLERKRFPRKKVCGEYLSGTSLPLLDRLGVGHVFRDAAGPAVTHVGLFAGERTISAPLPRPGALWGRALSRDRLDTLLLERAAQAGADVRQPASATSIEPTEDGHACRIEDGAGGEGEQIRSRIVIAAHGSWEAGTLPTQPARRAARDSDLFGFKAHFVGAHLAEGLMPLLAFEGGYGGMVHVDRDQTSLSFCLRRDALRAVREEFPGEAGEAGFAHIARSCAGARDALGGGTRVDEWLGAGPIRPGARPTAAEGVFPVGNAAGEAHPVVAEGICMAIQGAFLLARRLIAWRQEGAHRRSLGSVGASYARDWRRAFAPRVAASAAVARWAMHESLTAPTLPMVGAFPSLLTWGARLAGKAARVPC